MNALTLRRRRAAAAPSWARSAAGGELERGPSAGKPDQPSQRERSRKARVREKRPPNRFVVSLSNHRSRRPTPPLLCYKHA